MLERKLTKLVAEGTAKAVGALLAHQSIAGQKTTGYG